VISGQLSAVSSQPSAVGQHRVTPETFETQRKGVSGGFEKIDLVVGSSGQIGGRIIWWSDHRWSDLFGRWIIWRSEKLWTSSASTIPAFLYPRSSAQIRGKCFLRLLLSSVFQRFSFSATLPRKGLLTTNHYHGYPPSYRR
jgi:hypothetical protein